MGTCMISPVLDSHRANRNRERLKNPSQPATKPLFANLKRRGFFMANKQFDDPSDICKAINEFLETLDVSDKTRRTYEEIFFLFVDRLRHDGSAVMNFKYAGPHGPL